MQMKSAELAERMCHLGFLLSSSLKAAHRDFGSEKEPLITETFFLSLSTIYTYVTCDPPYR